MTLEEIKKLLKSDEGKEFLDALLEDAVKGLKTKNAELLEKLNGTKSEKSDIEKRLEKLEFEKAEAEEKAAAKSGDVEKVKEQLTAKHQKEIEKLTSDITKLNGQLNTHVIGEGLTSALVKAKVAPALIEAAKALINSKFKGEVGDLDGKPFAKFDGKNAEEFVTGWAQSDAGKAFVLADTNSGGGSNGANGNGQAISAGKKTMTRTEFDTLSVTDKVKTSKEGVNLTD